MAIPAPWRREEGIASCTIDLEKRGGEGLRSNSVVYRVFTTSVTMRPFLPLLGPFGMDEWLGGVVSPLGLLRLSLTREMGWLGRGAAMQYGTAVKSKSKQPLHFHIVIIPSLPILRGARKALSIFLVHERGFTGFAHLLLP